MRRSTRLSETRLEQIISESVRRIVSEKEHETILDERKEEELDAIINEAVDEGFKNWAKGLAVAGAMALSPAQANAQTNGNGNIQNGTYWELTKGQNSPQQVTKEEVTPMFKNIKAVTANLADYTQYITTTLSKLNPQQKNEIEKAFLNHCIKNQQTGQLIKVNSFTLDDAAYIKQVYDSGDNIMTVNIEGTSYFITVSAANNAMMIMGMQQGTPSVVKMFMYHK